MISHTLRTYKSFAIVWIIILLFTIYQIMTKVVNLNVLLFIPNSGIRLGGIEPISHAEETRSMHVSHAVTMARVFDK